ncbi:MAG: hypothetical protein ACP5OG_00970 [Candidatus Nanoarchaeia archaeon]
MEMRSLQERPYSLRLVIIYLIIFLLAFALIFYLYFALSSKINKSETDPSYLKSCIQEKETSEKCLSVINKKDSYKECYLYEQELKDSCFYVIAIQNSYIDLCNAITNQDLHKKCINEVSLYD